MSRPLQRFVALAASVVVAAAFLVPLATAFAHPDLAVAFKCLAGALLVAGALAPVPALCGLTLLLPLSASMAWVWAGHPSAGAIPDGLLLAFLAGAALRVTWPQSSAPPTRLAGPSAVLIAAVLASAVVELNAIQRVTPRVALLPELWRYLTTDYWTTAREYPVVHHAIRWTSWLVLAVYAERIGAGMADRTRMVHVWILAGALGAALTATFVVGAILRSVEPAETMRFMLTSGRFSVLHPDVNAAGSYFALFLLPAATVAVRRRAWWLLATVVPALACAFAVARSRAALGAFVLVLGITYIARVQRANAPGTSMWRRSVLLPVLTMTAVAVLVAGVAVATSRSNVDAGIALQYRVQMTRVALTAIQRHTIFGGGIGQYIPTTRRFINADAPLLQRHAPNGENAHNNYLQIAVELGVPATLLFLWLVGRVTPVAFQVRESRPSAELQGMALGLAIFLASALLGHPLLIPLVGATFFMALGMTAGLMPPVQTPAWVRGLLWAGGLFFAVSMAWRVA